MKASDRLTWFTGLSGLGLILLGGYTYAKQRKLLAGPSGLGRARVGQAPIVGGYSDGNMKTTLRASNDMPIEQRLATIQDLVHRSIQDGEMRKLALMITAHCPERDKMCEAETIYQAVKRRVRYTGDVGAIAHPDGSVDGIDLYQSARRTWELKGGDCLPAGTLLLNDRHELVPIEKVLIGSRIWGRDRWSEVKDIWTKGVMPVDVVHMNNGSSFMATSDHKVYVAICTRHIQPAKPCACPINERSIERISVGQLKLDMVLIQPETSAIKLGKLLRVKEIDRAIAEKSVYDISTDDHYVYLPEADVVVSNCDDQSLLNATLLALNGINPVLRVVRQKGDDDWSHIFCGFYNGKKFVALDTTLPGNRSFGVEGTYVKFKDFPA